MITLSMTTVRHFSDKREYNEYQMQIKEFMKVDWKELEEYGSTEIKNHKEGEKVLTELKLEGYENNN